MFLKREGKRKVGPLVWTILCTIMLLVLIPRRSYQYLTYRQRGGETRGDEANW